MNSASVQPETQVPILIEVWAPWCSACRAVEPDVLAVAESHRRDVVLERVDASTDRSRVSELGVLGTPSFVGIKHGRVVFRRTGRLSRTEIEDMFDALANDVHLKPRGRHDESVLAIAAGAVLVVAGMLTGPSLPLAISGGTLMAGGAGLWLRRRRDD